MAAAALRGSLRSSWMSFARYINQPATGILNISFLESHFISHGRWLISRMSTNDSWFDTTTYGWRGSSGIVPDTRNDHSGLSRWCTTGSFRNR